MRLPFLRTAPQEQKKQIGQFLGLNRNLIINENEFSDMQNMSSDRFPAICTRRSRGVVMKTLGKPHGLCHKNGLAYVDGTSRGLRRPRGLNFRPQIRQRPAHSVEV